MTSLLLHNPLELGENDLGDVGARLGHEADVPNFPPVGQRDFLIVLIEQLVLGDHHLLPVVGGGDSELARIIPRRENQGLGLRAVELEAERAVRRSLPLGVAHPVGS